MKDKERRKLLEDVACSSISPNNKWIASGVPLEPKNGNLKALHFMDFCF